MQNLVVLMNPPDLTWDVSPKAGNMCLNRFCIDEDAACELSGIYYLQNIRNSPVDDLFLRPNDKHNGSKGTEFYVLNIQLS